MTDQPPATSKLTRWCRVSELMDARKEQRWPTCYSTDAPDLVEVRITFDWSKP